MPFFIMSVVLKQKYFACPCCMGPCKKMTTKMMSIPLKARMLCIRWFLQQLLERVICCGKWRQLCQLAEKYCNFVTAILISAFDQKYGNFVTVILISTFDYKNMSTMSQKSQSQHSTKKHCKKIWHLCHIHHHYLHLRSKAAISCDKLKSLSVVAQPIVTAFPLVLFRRL